MHKVHFVGMLDNIDLMENKTMVDSKDMVNKQQTFGNLKFLVDTSGWTRWTC